jgi:hypothetical protein
MAINVLRWGICLVYGGLTIFACIGSLSSDNFRIWTAVLMGIASLCLIVLNINYLKNKFILLIPVLLVLQFCAIMNGYYLGQMNILHHAVRLLVHVVIFLLFFVSSRKIAK